MTDAGSDDTVFAVVLDFLPTGHHDDSRQRYRRSPVAYALGEEDFGLYELRFEDGAKYGVGDRLAVDPPADDLAETDRIAYGDLTGTARSELEYAVDELIDRDEKRFVDFYNDAQPITLRLHQLNLLPGIGKKLRNNILDARKRKPFESFDDLDERVSGLHRPREVLKERILEELSDADLKYRIFARQAKRE
ncbi:DUF655 domain-containing protein [Natronomonas sp. EA1]|uniref:DUF655 domain-containing protein n=1 Tax=Natronomonas sp. EA1 TaxID=3421655 RepID=UPI003EBF0D3F